MALQTKYSKAVLINFALFFAVHLLASSWGFYYIAQGFDKVMHFWGGVSVALFFIWYFYFSGRFTLPLPKDSKIFFIFLIVGLVALVGVGWEFFEYIGNNYIAKGQMQGDLTDTMGDLFADLVGGLVFSLCFLPKIKKIS